MNALIFRTLPLLLAALLLVQATWAQLPFTEPPRDMKPLAVGSEERFFSKALGSMRQLNVYTPQGYDTLPPAYPLRGNLQKTPAYPVIYLLDGTANEDFLHVAGILQFMNMMEMFPPHILAGIANEKRRHDFTHPATDPDDLKLIPESGGSGTFIPFLGEAQTYMDNYFWTGGQRTLIGQSLGGLLATEILLTKPYLFNRYIIVSPSLWWNKGSLLASAAEKIKAWPQIGNIEVYIVVGKEGDRMEKDAAGLAEVLRAAKVPYLRVDFMRMPEETHATILHNALYQTFLKIGQGTR